MGSEKPFIHLLGFVVAAGKMPVAVLFCLCRVLTCCRRQKARSRRPEKGSRSFAKDCCVKSIFLRRKKFFSGSRGKDCARCVSRCSVKPIFRSRKIFFSRHCVSRCRVKPIFRRRKKSYCRSCVKGCGSCAKNCRPFMSSCKAPEVFLSPLSSCPLFQETV